MKSTTTSSPLEKGFVVPAQKAQIQDCLEILRDSILGQYFEPPLAASILESAHSTGGLHVAVAEGRVEGFYVNEPMGAFLVFPYLHLLAVRTSNRGKGIGTALLTHLETAMLLKPGYPSRPKIFLLVASDNLRAVSFYVRTGYTRIAAIDDMFGPGDTELIMMKDLGEKSQL